MSFLRRRFAGGDSSNETSREPTPDPDRPANLRVVTAEKLQQLKGSSKKKNGKRKNFWIFALGGLFGLVVAAFFADRNDMLDLSRFEDLNLESLMDALPSSFVKDAQRLQVCTLLLAMIHVKGESTRLRERALMSKYL